MIIEYTSEATEHLSKRDKKLGEAIARIGHLERQADADLFSSVVHQIIGQQISTSALNTVWQRLEDLVEPISAENLLGLSRDRLQSIGVTYRKADYILDFASRVKQGDIDLDGLASMPDEQVIKELTAVKGIGVWTAEMLMTFCLQRQDVVSFGDLGILRGMRMLYRRKEITRESFERYRRRYSPYGTVASLYLWAIACGAIPELYDPAQKRVEATRSK